MNRRHDGLALGLLAAFLAAQFIWQAFEPRQQFAAWTASQSAWVTLLLAVIAAAYPSRPIRAAAALAGACSALSSYCSVRWLIEPFDTTGHGRCSDAFNFPVGVLVAALALVLAWRLYVGGRNGRSNSNRS